MEMSGTVKYIIIIAVILGVAFLSQQAISRGYAKPLVSAANNKIATMLAQGSHVVTSKAYSNISGEVASGGDTIQQGVAVQQKNISDSLTNKISNYISGVTNALAGKTPASCPTTNPTTN